MSKNTEVLVSREYRATGGKQPHRRHISISGAVKARLKARCAERRLSMSSVVEALTDERALEAFAARLRAGEAA